MSYREIRNLTEHLKTLGFYRTVSIENFTNPNFQLVAEILTWAVKIVDSDFEIAVDIDHEHDRIFLIRNAAIFFYQKLGIRMNTMKIYGADRLAARELLKVTTSIYKATLEAVNPSTDEGLELDSTENINTNISGKDIREVRQLASSIVMDAASLHDSLNKEINCKIQREATLNVSLDVDRLEATLVAALHALSVTIEEIKESSEQMEKQEEEIKEKIQKKNESLTRNCRRLDTLNRIKPTWQSELEQEEAELRSVWDEYIIKHKNLAYLERQLEDLDEQQQQQLEEAMQLGREAAAADLMTTEGNTQKMQVRNRRVFGSMTGESIDSTEDSESDDSFLNDSASDDDSLSLFSKEEPKDVGQPFAKSLYDYSMYPRPSVSLSGKAASRRPSSARPKSAHSESRVQSAWNGNVRGSGRVSPLSASGDSSEEF